MPLHHCHTLVSQAIEVMSGALVLLPPDDPALIASLVRPPGGETGLAYTAYDTAGADRVRALLTPETLQTKPILT